MEHQLPRRKKPGIHDFDTSTEAVKQWIADLPIINTNKARVLLNKSLEQINILDINPMDRYAAIELISTPVLYVTEALKNEFLGKPVPLQDKNLNRAKQCLELYNQMAIAYEIMAADLGRIKGKKPRLTTALHRAMRYLGESLLTNYQIYLQYPAGVWKSIHTLYTAAEKEGLTSKVVPDTTLPSATNSTIETVYKQILLLSLACPYRLRQKEIHYVNNALREWAVACHLSPAANKQDNGLFATNLLSDDPPSYRTLNSDSQLDEYRRILDTSEMAGLLSEAMTEDHRISGMNASIGGKDILKRLMLSWGVMPKRRFSRHQSITPVSLIIGLDSIHLQSETPAVETAPDQAVAEEEVHDRQYLQDPTFETTTRFKAHPGTSLTPGISDWNNPERTTTAASTAAATRVEAWKIADMSAGGYCLLLDSTAPTAARVGELIALRASEEARVQDWHLGVIRRIKFTQERGLEMGLQMLSPGALPVWVRSYSDNVGSTTRMKGILLPEIKSLRQKASLLLPSLPFRVGSTSILEYEDHKETIILSQQLENTGIFGQYHFTRAELS